MPCYDFACEECPNAITDAIYPVTEIPDFLVCEECGKKMPRSISVQFAVHTDEPKWIDKHLNDHVGNRSGPPLTSRKQLDSYCAKRGLERMN